MQEQRLSELEDQSTRRYEDLFENQIEKQLEAKKVIRTELEAMRSQEKILTLSEEEERILRCFRSFKARCKPGAVFKWQTRPPEEVTVVQETGLIQDPQDVSNLHQPEQL